MRIKAAIKSLCNQGKAMLFMIICIVVSSLSLLLAIESIYNYYNKIIYGDSDTRTLQLLINENADFKKTDLKKLLADLPENISKEIDSIYAQAYYDENPKLSTTHQMYIDNKKGTQIDYGEHVVVAFHFTYKNGDILNNKEEMQALVDQGILSEDEVITDSQYKNGEKIILIDKDDNPFYKNKEDIDLFGEKYKITGDLRESLMYNITVPFTAIPDNTILTCHTEIYLSHPVTVSEYKTVKKLISTDFGDKLLLEDMEFDNTVNRHYYITVFVVSVIILAIALFNFLILGNYIFTENRKRYGIYILCGARRINIFKEYFLMTTIISCISLMLGFGIFKAVFDSLLIKYYEFYLSNIYMIFGITLGIYIIVNCIVSYITCMRNIKKDRSGDKLC